MMPSALFLLKRPVRAWPTMSACLGLLLCCLPALAWAQAHPAESAPSPAGLPLPLWLVVLLLLVVFGGATAELKVPGTAAPGLLALAAAAVLFVPLYGSGHASGWEIGLFVLGLLLIALEVWVIPGTGVSGLVGFLGVILATALALIPNPDLDSAWAGWRDVLTWAFKVTILLVMAALGAIWGASALLRSRRMTHPIIDANTLDRQSGYTAADGRLQALVGHTATTASDLRPYGTIEVDGLQVDARVQGAYLVRGTAVRIVGLEDNNLLVRPLDVLATPPPASPDA